MSGAAKDGCEPRPETPTQALDRLRGEWRARTAAHEPVDDIETLGRAIATLIDGGLT